MATRKQEGRPASGLPPAVGKSASPARTALRWLLAGLMVALIPKCVVCLAGYMILLTGAGTAGQEFCGGPTPSSWLLLPAGVAAAWLALAVIRFLARFFRPAETDVRSEAARSLRY